MQFAHPIFLYITLALVPLLVAAGLGIAWLRQRDLKAFGETALVARLTRHISETRIQVRGVALVAGLLLLGLALAGPEYGSKMVEVQRQGVDVMIALDVSRSMLAEDIKPNRLSRAQQELTSLVDRLNGDRVGVIAFAGSAQVACPLTTDYEAAKMFLSYTTPNSVAMPGTALGTAIRTAVAAFPEGGAGHRVLVLLTDGEDHNSDPMVAAQEAKAAGVKILAIGFGTTTGEPIPERDSSGQNNGYHKDRSGQTVVSKLDEATLKQIADATSGVFVPSQNGVLEAGRLAELIDHMQKRAISAGRYGAGEDRFQFILLPALLVLLFSFWLPARKKSWLLLLPLLLGCQASWAGTADDVNQGNHAYHKGKFDKALQAYREAQIKSPENPIVTYDLGNALHQTGQYKEAEQAYQKLLAGKNQRLRAKAYYNLGNNYVQQKEYDKAIESYYQALKLKPRDEDTIYNLSQAMALKRQPQAQKDQKSDQDKDKKQSNQSQEQKAAAEQKSGKDKDQKNQTGPDDKGDRKSDQAQAQANAADGKSPGQAPKPGEMRKEDAENVLDAVHEAEQSALQDRLKQNQQQGRAAGEDW